MLTNPAHEPANLWVVTDLDGTLLDHHYDWSAAKATLTWLKQIGISVIPCTSKTAEEVRRFRRCLLYTSPSPRDVEESRMPSSA